MDETRPDTPPVIDASGNLRLTDDSALVPLGDAWQRRARSAEDPGAIVQCWTASERCYSEAVRRSIPEATRKLTILLTAQGRVDDAVALSERQLEAGEPTEFGTIAFKLNDQEAAAQPRTEELFRRALDAGEPDAAIDLAEFLVAHTTAAIEESGQAELRSLLSTYTARVTTLAEDSIASGMLAGDSGGRLAEGISTCAERALALANELADTSTVVGLCRTIAQTHHERSKLTDGGERDRSVWWATRAGQRALDETTALADDDPGAARREVQEHPELLYAYLKGNLDAIETDPTRVLDATEAMTWCTEAGLPGVEETWRTFLARAVSTHGPTVQNIDLLREIVASGQREMAAGNPSGLVGTSDTLKELVRIDHVRKTHGGDAPPIFDEATAAFAAMQADDLLNTAVEAGTPRALDHYFDRVVKEFVQAIEEVDLEDPLGTTTLQAMLDERCSYVAGVSPVTADKIQGHAAVHLAEQGHTELADRIREDLLTKGLGLLRAGDPRSTRTISYAMQGGCSPDGAERLGALVSQALTEAPALADRFPGIALGMRPVAQAAEQAANLCSPLGRFEDDDAREAAIRSTTDTINDVRRAALRSDVIGDRTRVWIGRDLAVALRTDANRHPDVARQRHEEVVRVASTALALPTDDADRTSLEFTLAEAAQEVGDHELADRTYASSTSPSLRQEWSKALASRDELPVPLDDEQALARLHALGDGAAALASLDLGLGATPTELELRSEEGLPPAPGVDEIDPGRTDACSGRRPSVRLQVDEETTSFIPSELDDRPEPARDLDRGPDDHDLGLPEGF